MDHGQMTTATPAARGQRVRNDLSTNGNFSEKFVRPAARPPPRLELIPRARSLARSLDCKRAIAENIDVPYD